MKNIDCCYAVRLIIGLFLLFALLRPVIAVATDIDLCDQYDLTNPVDLSVSMRQQKVSGDGPFERLKSYQLHCEAKRSIIANIQIRYQRNEGNADSALIEFYNVSCQDYSNPKTCSEKLTKMTHEIGYPSRFQAREFGLPIVLSPEVKTTLRIQSVEIRKLSDTLRAAGLTVQGDSINSLNKLLLQSDLLDIMLAKTNKVPSEKIVQLLKLYADSKTADNLKRLNRIALQEFFPETPRKDLDKRIELGYKTVDEKTFSPIPEGDYRDYIQDATYATVCVNSVFGGLLERKKSFMQNLLSLVQVLAPLAGGLAPGATVIKSVGKTDLPRTAIGEAGNAAGEIEGRIGSGSDIPAGKDIPLCVDYDQKIK